MQVLNKSHRASIFNKVYNSIPNPASFSMQSSRRLAYMQRLYFEYMYTLKVGGQVFFYTLTYNDDHIPTYNLGQNPDGTQKVIYCFNYDHIRYVTVGSLEKTLKRYYGTRLRYFCACESGEGKGKRGKGNNPHYHFIFFLQPHTPDYKEITPVAFRSLVRKLWQGAERIAFQKAKFGQCKEGDLLGKVYNVSALKYVAKYVIKDTEQCQNDNAVFQYWQDFYKRKGLDTEALIWYYWYLTEFYGSPQRHLYDDLRISRYNWFRKHSTAKDKSYISYVTRYCDDLNAKVHLTELYQWYTDYYLNMRPILEYRNYLNKYSAKCRYSKSLGEYGLNFVLDPDFEPRISIPSAEGYDIQPLCMYYYRRLYYDYYKCDVTGNVLYRLNERGKKQHIASLESRLFKFYNRLNENLTIVRPASLLPEPLSPELKWRYAVYKLIYEYRCFKSSDIISEFSLDAYSEDYKRFIDNDSVFFDYDLETVYLKRYFTRDYFNYSDHPWFKPHKAIFQYLDELNFKANDIRSEISKSKFKETAETQKRLKAMLNS